MIKQRKEALLLMPGLLGVLAFYVLPMWGVGRYSLSFSAFDNTFVGLHNYAQVLRNPYYQLALINTFRFSLVSIPALLVLALILAHLVQGRHRFLQATLLLPGFIPSAAVVGIWLSFSTAFYSFLTVPEGQLQEAAILSLFLWKNIGVFTLIMLSALKNVPAEVTEAACVDGASALRQVLSIRLPLMLPHIMFAAIYALVCSLKIFRESYLMFGSYPEKNVYFIQHYMNNHFSKLDYHTLSSSSILFFLPLLLIFGVMLWMERKLTQSTW